MVGPYHAADYNMPPILPTKPNQTKPNQTKPNQTIWNNNNNNNNNNIHIIYNKIRTRVPNLPAEEGGEKLKYNMMK
jgi:hypothetical protein